MDLKIEHNIKYDKFNQYEHHRHVRNKTQQSTRSIEL